MSTPPPFLPDWVSYRAVGFVDATKRPIDDKVREILRRLDWRPTRIDTSAVDAPGELDVDGVPVVGQTWIQRGAFYAVRRP